MHLASLSSKSKKNVLLNLMTNMLKFRMSATLYLMRKKLYAKCKIFTGFLVLKAVVQLEH